MNRIEQLTKVFIFNAEIVLQGYTTVTKEEQSRELGRVQQHFFNLVLVTSRLLVINTFY
jgi:hypothetical protein